MVRREVIQTGAELEWPIPVATPEATVADTRVPASLDQMKWVPFDPNHPIGVLVNITRLVTRYPDSIVTKVVREPEYGADRQG